MAYTQRMEPIKLVIGQVSIRLSEQKNPVLVGLSFSSCTKGDTSLDKSVRYLQTYILVFMSNFANLFDYYLKIVYRLLLRLLCYTRTTKLICYIILNSKNH